MCGVRSGFVEHHARSGEACDTIDVPVGFEFVGIPGQPDHLADAQSVTYLRFRFPPGETGITIVVEHNGLGRQDSAFAIDMKSPSFENQR